MSDQFAINFNRPASDPRVTATTFVRAKPDLFRADFEEWLARNWHVWQAFEREANFVWDRGRRHYSARTIGEYLRHETLVREADCDFKVNDWYWPDLARLYLMIYPDREGFFERRSGVSAKRAA